MKSFVTGSTGMVGSNLVHLLVEKGYEVRALVRSEKKGREMLGHLERVRLIIGDMENVEAFAGELSECHVLFHTAAYFREYYGPGEHEEKLQRINVEGTMELLKEAERQRVEKVIYVSTAGVVGSEPDGSPANESTPPGKGSYENLYFRSKLEAEKEIDTFLKNHTLPVVLILPAVIMGPRNAGPTPSGRFLLDYMNRRIPAIVKGGMPLVDARDVAFAMMEAVEKGRSGERHILGGNFIEMEELLKMMEEITGIPGPRWRIPNFLAGALAHLAVLQSRLRGKSPPITPKSVKMTLAKMRLDSTKAVRELGVEFRAPKETLIDTVEWFREHGYVRE
ncbi:MAG: SDR family oxidoreductase [Deltaproteobacteria bacterium]|jgi:dihydroflavonol-4-reductase